MEYLLLSLTVAAVACVFLISKKAQAKQHEQPSRQTNFARVPSGSPACSADAPVQNLQYFSIKDKGYHVSVWPKDHSQFDVVEFNIAGLSYRDNIDNYLGEFVGTLEAEPTNAYDSNAIKVLAADGHHVGYVPKDMTAEVRNNFTLPCSCYCYIGNNNGTYYSDCYILCK
jgi:hypothetical protein